MRLLKYEEDGKPNVVQFDDSTVPPYAILSHTWGSELDEVTFADIVNGHGHEKSGYEKIRFCRERVRQDGLEYFWIDTCCIDQADNAELSYSIRSMFRWYQNATKCYVYLADVSARKRKVAELNDESTWEHGFKSSRWFTRGWTLQELVAPTVVEFFSREGEKLGDKASLKLLIQRITTIPQEVLDGASLHQFPINERLRWKGNRKTKREEDVWYSLQGIFGVDIAPAYSEGASSAFGRLMNEIHNVERCIRDVRHTDPRDDKARIEETQGGLLEDSYRWVLENDTFRHWQSDPQSQLLWVKGDPGKGKTMLLCGIIDQMHDSLPRGDLLAYFFCQATDSRINSAVAILRGLLYMLVDQQQSLVSHIRQKYNHAGKSIFEDANAWVVLTEIFANLLQDEQLGTVYLIIDGLDECTSDLPKLLEFVEKHSSASSRVKWIVSSRNWPSIEAHLGSKTKLSLELNAEVVAEAVDIFIKLKVDQITQRKQLKAAARSAVLQHLNLNANGTFLWVALVCQDLEKTPRWNILKKLALFPPGLDYLYERIMFQINELDSDQRRMCHELLASTAVLYQPVTILELTTLVEPLNEYADDPETVQDIVSSCGSFLTIRQDKIYFVHQSARDFLLAKKYHVFPNGTEYIHRKIFSTSLETLSRVLHRDMYSLHKLDSFINDIKPPKPDPLIVSRYPCCYWIDHLCDSNPEPGGECVDVVNKFMRKSYLHWLEALSLCSNTEKGIISMTRFLSSSQLYDDDLVIFMEDAYRFVMYHKGAIESYPLQVYMSALVFSPTGSLIRNSFRHEESAWINIWPKMAQGWSACLQTLEDRCSAVTFRPNANQLATASLDGKVRIWDSSSGSCLQSLEGHMRPVSSVAFSKDSTRLASVSGDDKVRVWDANNGICLSTSCVPGIMRFKSVFSPDLAFIASGMLWGNEMVKVWNPTSGECLSTFESPNNEYVQSLAFSHDSAYLALGFYSTIKIWDFISNKHTRTLNWRWLSSSLNRSIAFSHDSSLLASGLNSGMIVVFDAKTGDTLHVFESHGSGVFSMAFSHDSTRLASASGDETVKIYDLNRKSAEITLDGHYSEVKSVAFSHDSKQVASVTQARCARIWDARGGECIQAPDDHTSTINSVVFSHDSTWIASASDDKTIRIWDTSTCKCVRVLSGHRESVYMTVFSCDWPWLASASMDKTVRVWNLISGICLSSFEGHSGGVVAVAFSNDSTQLASASMDRTIKLWNSSSGECLLTMNGHVDRVTAVAFSHDSRKLASLSDDRTARIWDIASRQCVQILKGHGDPSWNLYYDRPANYISFSHDDSRLVSLSCQCEIKIWDLNSSKCLHTFDTEEKLAKIAFAENDLYLTSGMGPIAIPSSSDPKKRKAILDVRPLLHHYAGLSLDRNWITYNSVNVLRLPLEYRPACSAVSGSSVAIAVGGRVLIIAVAPNDF